LIVDFGFWIGKRKRWRGLAEEEEGDEDNGETTIGHLEGKKEIDL
jgi:hypothetical protein